MKKITLFLLFPILAFSQQKTTGDIVLSNAIPVVANFTLNNDTSQVTLILKGPSDRWFGLGVGVEEDFSMSDGDALVYSENTTPKLTDRNFIGTQQPPQDSSQDWTIVDNTVSGSVRTLTLTRALTNSDGDNDFQFPYATTNSISVAGVRPPTANNNVAPHGGTTNVGYRANIAFTTLGVEDFSLNASQVYPNPSNGEFLIKAKTTLSQVNIYSQTGAFVKTVIVEESSDATEINVKGLQTGVYLLELVNATEKSWKKIIVY